MDFKKFDLVSACEKGLTFNVEYLGEVTDIEITVAGVFSRAYKEAHAAIDALMEECSKQKREAKDEELLPLMIDLCVKCTLGWKNISEDGADIEFNEENARKVYGAYDINPLRTQVIDKIHALKEMALGK